MVDREVIEEIRTSYAGTADEFNGWKNRETWAAALHLSNDEYLYNVMLELCSEGKRWSCADKIEAWVTEEVNMILYPDSRDEQLAPALIRSMICDVGSFWRVAWEDVADSFMPENQ